jgi:hypothetical protein
MADGNTPTTQRSLFHFFSKSRTTTEGNVDGDSTVASDSSSSSRSIHCRTTDVEGKSDNRAGENSEVDQPCSRSFSASVAVDSVEVEECSSSGSRIEIPVDRLTRDEYIRRGPVRDSMDDYPKTTIAGKQRSFQTQWFEGRHWLEYIIEYNAAFCFPCRVFGKTVYDATFQKHGFRQWHRALESKRGFDKHSLSNEHGVNVQAWQDFLLYKPVDSLLDEEKKRLLEQGNQERRDRYDILPLLLDVTSTLGRLRLPFRGHDETEESENKGVFLEVLELIARWNTGLESHLNKSHSKPKSYPSYTSPTSQNELINCSAQFFRDITVKNVKEAQFFAVCLDTTPDSGKQDQLSIILRYVGKAGDLSEDLVDIVHAESMTAEGLFDVLASFLQKYELKICDIRGQGYDGCSTMSGCYTGVQSRVRAVNKCAYFVHCFAHRLNLVIVDTCSKNTKVRNFFGIVASLYDFIEGSTKRHAVFKAVREQIESEMEKDDFLERRSGSRKLHSLSTTRWSSRVDNCHALTVNLVGVTKTLETIANDESYDRKTAAEASCLLKAMDFEFCLTLTILSDLLEDCHLVSKNLQNPKLNIAAAAHQVSALIKTTEQKRTEEYFDMYWKSAEEKAESIGVEYTEPRSRKVSRRIDDHWSTEASTTGQSRLRASLHFEVIDLLLSALRTRFGPEVMPLLNSTDCLVLPTTDKMSKVETLCSFYPTDIDNRSLKVEYRLFCHAMDSVPDSEVDKNCIQSMYQYMVNTGMLALYPNLGLAYKLILTLPVSSCSCERSFSALKFVKNSLRSTMSQDRLSDLMILAVQGRKLDTAGLKNIRDEFWNRSLRK